MPTIRLSDAVITIKAEEFSSLVVFLVDNFRKFPKKSNSESVRRILEFSSEFQIVTFSDFLGNFRKLSTKNTTKLENSSAFYRVVGTVSK